MFFFWKDKSYSGYRIIHVTLPLNGDLHVLYHYLLSNGALDVLRAFPALLVRHGTGRCHLRVGKSLGFLVLAILVLFKQLGVLFAVPPGTQPLHLPLAASARALPVP